VQRIQYGLHVYRKVNCGRFDAVGIACIRCEGSIPTASDLNE